MRHISILPGSAAPGPLRARLGSNHSNRLNLFDTSDLADECRESPSPADTSAANMDAPIALSGAAALSPVIDPLLAPGEPSAPPCEESLLPLAPQVDETSSTDLAGPGETEPAESLAIATPAIESEAPPEPAPRRRSYDGDASFTLYLQEIGQVKLLTPEEELQLAERIRQGDKEARELMIKANLRLVVKIARDYEGIGLPLLDLISEGNIGLMKAVERFDPAKGAKLSTYASWWIKQSMKRALANQSKTIRLPVHLIDKISRMRRCAMQLQDQLGREPTDEELAEELGVPSARVAQLRMASTRPASLDGPIAGDETTSLGELVPDEKAESPDEQLEGKHVLRMVHQLVQSLSPREARILRARFGLDGSPQASLDEVGRALGVTRERIRQLQQTALAKLRKMIERRNMLSRAN